MERFIGTDTAAKQAAPESHFNSEKSHERMAEMSVKTFF